MKKTEQMINAFLQQVEQDRELAQQKLTHLKYERDTLERERSEISKAVIRFENSGDQDAVSKLSKELEKKVTEIGVIDSRTAAYAEMGNSYESEAEKVFIAAAKELNEDYPKVLEQANVKLTSARKALEDANSLVMAAKAELSNAEKKVNSVKHNARYVIEDRLNEVLKYMPDKLKELEAPKPQWHYETETEEHYYPGFTVGSNIKEGDKRKGEGTYKTSHQTYVEDSENYGDGMEGKLNYYYKEVMTKEEAATNKKTLVDKILGR